MDIHNPYNDGMLSAAGKGISVCFCLCVCVCGNLRHYMHYVWTVTVTRIAVLGRGYFYPLVVGVQCPDSEVIVGVRLLDECSHPFEQLPSSACYF